MKNFSPCKGKTACRDDGETCLTCGRSLAEIKQTRDLIDAMSAFIQSEQYENVDEFVSYLADKVEKKIKYHRDTPNS